jgi:hypothetical protein
LKTFGGFLRPRRPAAGELLLTRQTGMKMKVTTAILEIYNHNKQKLSLELAKPEKDKSVLNSIAAYRHIITQMEERYNLTG